MTCIACSSSNIKFKYSKDKFKFFRCQSCGLIFINPTPLAAKEVYTDSYFNEQKGDNQFGYANYDQDKQAMRGTFELYLDEIEKNISIGVLFDVGTATGYFLNIAKERGWTVAGIEISDYASQVARDKGLDVLTGALPSDNIEKKFSVVTAWDVFEHFDDPVANLSAIYNLLQSGGLLALNTVNCESFWARIMGKRWHAILPPEHIYLYSKRSLIKLLSRNGFDILVTKTIGKKFTLPYIFKVIYNWRKRGFYLKLSNLLMKTSLKNISIPINLGDNIFIIARKK